MSARSPEDLTLRERVKVAIRLNRELLEHVEQSLMPKVQDLRRMTRPNSPSDDPPAGDRTVHAQAAAVLEADHYTVDLYQRLQSYCESIRRTLAEIDS